MFTFDNLTVAANSAASGVGSAGSTKKGFSWDSLFGAVESVADLFGGNKGSQTVVVPGQSSGFDSLVSIAPILIIGLLAIKFLKR